MMFEAFPAIHHLDLNLPTPFSHEDVRSIAVLAILPQPLILADHYSFSLITPFPHHNTAYSPYNLHFVLLGNFAFKKQ
jgi:hypothetical protein